MVNILLLNMMKRCHAIVTCVTSYLSHRATIGSHILKAEGFGLLGDGISFEIEPVDLGSIIDKNNSIHYIS